MKPLNFLKITVGFLMFTPCIAQDNKNSDDGIYSTPSSSSTSGTSSSTQANSGSFTSSSNPSDSGNSSAIGQGNDAYYDNNYDYTAQIRRYDDNWGDWGYYDDVYTNSYWYSGDPYQWGMSIYMGSPWWGPAYYGYFYNPCIYWGLGWGNPYWAWNSWGWGYPYWGCGFGWGYPYCGWYGWGGCGNWWGCGNYYYNSYEPSNNYHYGPRNVVGSHTINNYASHNGEPIRNNYSSMTGQRTFGQAYQGAIRNEVASHPASFVASSHAINDNAYHVAFSAPKSNISNLSNGNHVNLAGRPNSGNNMNRNMPNSNYGNSSFNNHSNVTNGSNRPSYNYPRPGNYTPNTGNNSTRYNSGNTNRPAYRQYNSQQRAFQGNNGRSYGGNYGGSRPSYNSGGFGGHSYSSGGSRGGFSGGGHSGGFSSGGGHSSGGGGGHSSGGGGGHSGGGHR